MEAEILGAASGSSAIVAVLVIIIRDLIKGRNGGTSATRSDISKLSDKLSSDIGGVYSRLDNFTERCHERHATLERTVYTNQERSETNERRIERIENGKG